MQMRNSKDTMKGRRWLWFLAWILSLVGISYYGGAVSYGLFWALTLLPVVSLVYLLCVYFRFKLYQEVESRDMVCGQAMPYYFMLRNEDKFGFAGVKVRMFPDFSYVEDVAEDVEYELLPGDEFIYRTQLVCKYRGEYEVGVKEVIVTDFFRIFRFRYPVIGTIRAIVKPKLVELTQIYAMADVVVDLQKESLLLKTDPDVVVRDYMQGDGLKKIHWKATARTGQLKVRNDIGSEKQGVKIFFDTRRYSKKIQDYLPLESKILEVLLALGMFFAKRNMATTAYCEYRGLWNCEMAGMQGFESFYSQTSNIHFEEDVDSFESMKLFYQEGHLADAKVLIGIFHEWNEQMQQFAQEVADSGTTALFYVVTEENLEYYIKQNTTRSKVIAIGIDDELEGVM